MGAPRVEDIVKRYSPSIPLDAELDDVPVIRVMNRAVMLTLTENGVKKRIHTNRKGLEYLRDVIDAALDCPVSNINGIQSGNVRD